MAAAYRNKRRRTQLRKRTKHTTCRKIRPRRRPLPKRRKHLVKRRKLVKKMGRRMVSKKIVNRRIVSKRAEPSKPRYHDSKRPYDEFVVKVLQRLHRDKVPISTKAKGKMISFIRRFYNNVSEKARCSKRCKDSCTIGSRELQNALKRVMRKKHAMELVKTIRNVSRRH